MVCGQKGKCKGGKPFSQKADSPRKKGDAKYRQLTTGGPLPGVAVHGYPCSFNPHWHPPPWEGSVNVGDLRAGEGGRAYVTTAGYGALDTDPGAYLDPGVGGKSALVWETCQRKNGGSGLCDR